MFDWLQEQLWWLRFRVQVARRRALERRIPASGNEFCVLTKRLMNSCIPYMGEDTVQLVWQVEDKYCALLDHALEGKIEGDLSELDNYGDLVPVDKSVWNASTMKRVMELESRVDELEEHVSSTKEFLGVCDRCEGRGTWTVSTSMGKSYSRDCPDCVGGVVVDEDHLKTLVREGGLWWLENR